MTLLLPENENDLNFKILPKIMKEVFSKTSTKISMFLYIMWGHGCFKLKPQLLVRWKLLSLPRCTGAVLLRQPGLSGAQKAFPPRHNNAPWVSYHAPANSTERGTRRYFMEGPYRSTRRLVLKGEHREFHRHTPITSTLPDTESQ